MNGRVTRPRGADSYGRDLCPKRSVVECRVIEGSTSSRGRGHLARFGANVGAAGCIALPYRYYPTDKLISFVFSETPRSGARRGKRGVLWAWMAPGEDHSNFSPRSPLRSRRLSVSILFTGNHDRATVPLFCIVYPPVKLISCCFVPFVVPSWGFGLNQARTFPLNLKLGKSGRIAAT